MRVIRTVGELKKYLSDLPDDMILVHSKAVSVSNIHLVDDKFYSFCYTPENGPEYNCCKVVGLKTTKSKGLSIT